MNTSKVSLNGASEHDQFPNFVFSLIFNDSSHHLKNLQKSEVPEQIQFS